MIFFDCTQFFPSFAFFREGGWFGLLVEEETTALHQYRCASSSGSLWATTRSDDTPHNYSAGGFMQNFTRFLLLLPLLLLMATDTTNTAEPRVCGVCLYTDCLTD